MVKKKDVLRGIPINKGTCDICKTEAAIWNDIEKGVPVNVCDKCAHRPIGKVKKSAKKKK